MTSIRVVPGSHLACHIKYPDRFRVFPQSFGVPSCYTKLDVYCVSVKFSKLPTNSMEQARSWEANRPVAGQEVSRIL